MTRFGGAATLQRSLTKLERRVSPAPWPESRYQPHGSAAEVWDATDRELLVAGPVGTGKSRGNLEKVHRLLRDNPGVRVLLVRKTRASLTESGLVTFEDHVLGPGHPLRAGPQRKHRQSYVYPNGSVLVVGGVDNSERIMSTEYDVVVVMEATELTEPEWEDLSTRLRNHRLPFQMMLGDCNPGPPNHWLKQREARNVLRIVDSKHRDNPRLYDHSRRCWTDVGREYLGRLESLTGVRRLRNLLGIWAAAEGMILEGWSTRNLLDALPFDPKDARARIAGVDWGFTSPGVIVVGLTDGDGRLYVVRQVYRSQRTIDWWIEQAQSLKQDFGVETFLCDPSQPGHVAQFRRAGLDAIKANNDVRLGIQAMQQRVEPAQDGLPRFFVVRDSLAEVDQELKEAGKPVGVEQEVEGYVWQPGKEAPVKEDDHGLDACRYVIAHLDLKAKRKQPATSRSYGRFRKVA